MATNTWSSLASTDGNLAANWSLLALSPTDDLVFDTTSVVNCTFTGAITCNTLTVNTHYSGTFNDGGQAFTVASTVNIGIGGTRTVSGTWTQTGNANFTDTGTTSATWNLILQGTGTLTFIRAKSLSCAFTGKVTTIPAGSGFSPVALINNSTCLTTNGGTFTNNNSDLALGLQISVTGSTTPLSLSGTWNGTGLTTINAGANSVTITIPAITATQNFNLGTGSYTGTTFNITGTINITGGLNSYDFYGGGLVFTTNNNAITVSGDFYSGLSGASNSSTYNFGSSAMSVGSFTHDGSAPSAAYNLQTSTWTCEGNWTWSATGTTTVSPGTSLVTFNTNSATITSAGKSFYDVVFNQSTKTWTLADALSCHTITITAGTLDASTFNCTVSSATSVTGILKIGVSSSTGLTTAGLAINTNGKMDMQTASIVNNSGNFSAPNQQWQSPSYFRGTYTQTTSANWTNPSYFGCFYSFTINSGVTLTNQAQGYACGEDSIACTINGTFALQGASMYIGASATGTMTIGAAGDFTSTTTGVYISCVCRQGFTLVNNRSTAFSFTGVYAIASNNTYTGNILPAMDFSNAAVVIAGGSAAGKTRRIGAGTLKCKSLTFSPEITGGCTFDMATYNPSIVVSGLILIDTSVSTVTYTKGTGTYTLIGSSGSVNINFAGKDVESVTVNAAGATKVMVGALSTVDFTLTAGNWSNSGTTVTCSGNCTFNGTGTINFGTGITLNGASSALTINSTVGSPTASSCVLTFNGTTGCVLTNNKGVGFNSLILGASSVLTINGAAATTLSKAGTPLTLNNNSSLTLAIGLVLLSSISSDMWSIGTGCTITQSAGSIVCRPAAINLTLTYPAITITTGTGAQFQDGGFTGNTHKFLGAQNYGAAATLFRLSNAAGLTGTLNTNNQNLTCGTLGFGSNDGTSNVTTTLGSSTITCTALLASYNTGTHNFNMQTSTWIVTGNWTFGSTWTVTPGTSLVTFNTNSSTITSNSKTFYDLAFNQSGKTYTIADALSCHDLTITNGSLTDASSAITSSGDISFAGAGTINLGTSTITMSADKTLTFSSGPTYTTLNSIFVLQGNTAIVLATSVTISRLQTKTINKTITWNTGANILTVGSYTASDIGGTAGNLVLWRSSATPTRYKVSYPAGVVVSYMNVKDCDNVGTLIDASNGTNVDSFNNLGWNFGGTSKGKLFMPFFS